MCLLFITKTTRLFALSFSLYVWLSMHEAQMQGQLCSDALKFQQLKIFDQNDEEKGANDY